MAPPAHTATAATSTLCKLLTWHLDGTWQAAAAGGARPLLLHQADWLASLLHGQRGVSDWNNALKLGYDPGAQAYPEWLMKQVGGEEVGVCVGGGGWGSGHQAGEEVGGGAYPEWLLQQVGGWQEEWQDAGGGWRGAGV